MHENTAEDGILNAGSNAIQLALKEIVQNVEFVADVLRLRISIVVIPILNSVLKAQLAFAGLIHIDDQGNYVVNKFSEIPLWLGLTHVVDAVVILH